MSFRLSKKAAAAFLKGGRGGSVFEAPKPSKYRNRKVQLDGFTFDSVGESQRWAELKLRVLAGEIRHLERQVRYPLEVNGVPITTYVADFVYIEGTRRVIEDFKGVLTADAKIKLRLVKALFGIDVLLTRAKN